MIINLALLHFKVARPQLDCFSLRSRNASQITANCFSLNGKISLEINERCNLARVLIILEGGGGGEIDFPLYLTSTRTQRVARRSRKEAGIILAGSTTRRLNLRRPRENEISAPSRVSQFLSPGFPLSVKITEKRGPPSGRDGTISMRIFFSPSFPLTHF